MERAGDFNSPQPGVPKFQAPTPLLLSSSSSINKMRFQIVSYFWNGLFVCWSWRQASEVNSERCLQKKQNVSEVCAAIHRINRQVSQQGRPRARRETRGSSIRMGLAPASALAWAQVSEPPEVTVVLETDLDKYFEIFWWCANIIPWENSWKSVGEIWLLKVHLTNRVCWSESVSCSVLSDSLWSHGL